ncbi:hypothetical protein C8Q74DRAFT_1297816 [Fomes fomentarius]|nr:hypothetical protein C8Q74DRAFT_1297816 [Fomes fomentarius]
MSHIPKSMPCGFISLDEAGTFGKLTGLSTGTRGARISAIIADSLVVIITIFRAREIRLLLRAVQSTGAKLLEVLVKDGIIYFWYVNPLPLSVRLAERGIVSS